MRCRGLYHLAGDSDAEMDCVCRGLHGYSHENPMKMNLEQQHAILDKTYKDLTKFCGKPPRGNVAPVSYGFSEKPSQSHCSPSRNFVRRKYRRNPSHDYFLDIEGDMLTRKSFSGGKRARKVRN